jgi:hypothetical protein
VKNQVETFCTIEPMDRGHNTVFVAVVNVDANQALFHQMLFLKPS